MSSKAIASPAPVLGDFRLFRFLFAEPDRLVLLLFVVSAVDLCFGSADVGLVMSVLVLESNSLTVSRTRDLRSLWVADMVGRTGPAVGEARTRCSCRSLLPLTGDCRVRLMLTAPEPSFDSNRLGKEIGLGILDLEAADKGLLIKTFVPPLWGGDWELLPVSEVEALQTLEQQQ